MLQPSIKSSSKTTKDISVQKILKLKAVTVYSKVDFEGGARFSLIPADSKKRDLCIFNR
jgi:hypothetical protein